MSADRSPVEAGHAARRSAKTSALRQRQEADQFVVR